MPSRRQRFVDSSSSENSPPQNPSRRRLPSPPAGILRGSRHVTIMDPLSITRRVDRIADNLEDTSRNLESMDSRLSDFKDVHDDSMSALSKLKNDLEGSINKLRYEREKRAAARETRSLHQSDFTSSRGTRPRPASSLGFERTSRTTAGPSDHLNESVRDLRGRVSELVANQSRMDDELQYRSELGSRKALKEVNGNGLGDSAADRVERRLKQLENELVSERENAARFATDATRDLLRKSQAKNQDDEVVLRNQLLQAEAGKRAMETDMDSMRRRLEQSEGGREALMGQIADLRNQISKSEKSKLDLEQQVREQLTAQQVLREKEADERRLLASSQRYNDEKRKQEEEIADLRSALKHSVGVVQLDEMRKNLEKSERQRQQLSDHIEVLTKDLEKKDQSQARLLNQLHETQRTVQDTERDREKLSTQLEDALLKLQDYGRDTEKYMNELKKVERLHDDAEKEKDELRNQAQDTFRQWKAKCKKLEKENERLHDNVEQQVSKNEELVKENQTTKSQMNAVYQQNEALRKEMDDLISKRADLEERLQRRDTEISKSDDEMREMNKKIEESNQIIASLEDEVRQRNDRIAVIKEDLRRSQEETKAIQSLYETLKSQTTNMQKEIRELSIQKAELTSKLDAENTNRRTCQKRTEEAEKQMEAMRLELSALHKQLDIERETHKKEISKLRAQMHHNESLNADNMQKLNKKISDERDFLEREIHGINVEANESKAARRDAERKMLRSQEELQTCMKKNITLQNEIDKFREKYVNAKTRFEDKNEEVSKTSAELRKLEDDLIFARDRVKKMEQDLEAVQTALTQDIEDLSSALHQDDTALLLRRSMNDSDGICSLNDVHTWLSSMRHKIGVIKKEIYDRENEREKLMENINVSKTQMKEVCRTMEDDRRMLMAEATEQNKLVDVLSREKTSLLLENKEARRIVQELEDRVSNLTIDVETSKARAQEFIVREPPVKLSNSRDSKESMKERERIQERYAKYKNTIESLQNELRSSGDNNNNISMNDTNLSSSSFRLGGTSAPSPIRRVTIADAPPTIHGYSSYSRPLSSSPKQVPVKDRS
ncbi:uncharacterized protein LOC120326295 isoform X1 [Styela clava]